jgi:hypothetical protein
MKVFQIYFKEEQLPLLDYIPFYNKECSIFFENEVIRSLIEQKEHINDEYFGVVSYQLRDKVKITKTSWRAHKNIANHSINEFSIDQFEKELLKQKPDVMSYQCHMAHDPISYANNFHPNFSNYFEEIMVQIGYRWKPTIFTDVFYCNYFVAKSNIYERYVKEMLIPAMEVMKNMPELMNNSRYPKQLPEDLKKSFGINHYPYHPFLCERMFSYFAHLNKLRCLHY